MKLLNFTIFKLTICLIIGIVLAHYIELDFSLTPYSTILLIILLGIYWLILRQKINRSPYFALLAYLCMTSIGLNTYNIQNEKLQPDHYSNLTQNVTHNTLILKVKERLKPDAYNDKYIMSVLSFNEKVSSGKLLVNLKRDSLTESLDVDAILFTSSELENIQQPLNPHQFDYSKYLELQQVHHQLYIEKDKFRIVSNSKTSAYGYADQLRKTINERLISAGFKDDVLSIMNALLLGQRQTIDTTIYNNYVNSGTIHILAVSGLHVGIILWMLNFLFRPLLHLKYGNYIRPIVLVAILWSFAVIAGLSPSVTRAVTMFSIISIAMHLKRPANIYNTLAISAFLILLFKPTYLFAVGFQMSYLAVLGIVSIQPILYKFWKPKYLIPDKLWQIFTVTLAAQIGVVPISLFYFHQFPGLFFISNLVVIPFLGLILGFGLLVIVLALLNLLNNVIVTAYSFVIESLNGFIAWVAQFEAFLFRDIPFTLLQVICVYFIIIVLLQIYANKSFKWIVFTLIGIMAFQGTFIYNDFTNKDDAFIVFNKSRYSIIGLKHNDKLVVHHNLDSTKQANDNIIRNYKVGEMLGPIESDSLQHAYQCRDKTILVVDSLGVYKSLTVKPNFVLLRNSPRINLNRLIDSLHPEKIIADASNYKSYVKRWKASSRAKKIPFHYTNEKGAFILR
ncbi:ComEC/Rec2 family competence protein [Winogradskyella flava]|uniref:ComEC/Rec2 family competence protein n=1 Tax=Winogradskyella flava TaxID=1884876 RepID=A0A842IP54_9FLAO|nr:ComEC/Rec2 family competence protein [Winogradskyella flava]MBC2844445.1 ComEC/Rec2 family competence protein [Winogradskyella flava]